MNKFLKKFAGLLCVGSLTLLLNSCVGLVVGSTVDATVAVAKVPFKVAGAALDAAVPDDGKDSDEDGE